LSKQSIASPSGRTSVVQRDFFDESTPPSLGTFDLAYDYTFYCAIEPSRRQQWGEA